jgi:flagellar biosynthetic protein FliR
VTEAALLGEMPLLAFQAALLLCRLGACVMVLPGLGEADLPATLRLGLVLALVPLLLPGLAPDLPPVPDAVPEIARLVAVEVATGLWLGGLARLAAIALGMAGQAASFLTGLASVLAPDPALGQGTALSRLLGLAGATVVLSSGLYALPLRALAESYAVLPAGAPMATGPAAEAMAVAVAASFELALRLAAPLVLLSLLTQVASGLLTRIAPQAQVFVLTAPAQTLAGIGLLALVLPAILAHWADAARAAWALLPGRG